MPNTQVPGLKYQKTVEDLLDLAIDEHADIKTDAPTVSPASPPATSRYQPIFPGTQAKNFGDSNALVSRSDDLSM